MGLNMALLGGVVGSFSQGSSLGAVLQSVARELHVVLLVQRLGLAHANTFHNMMFVFPKWYGRSNETN